MNFKVKNLNYLFIGILLVVFIEGCGFKMRKNPSNFLDLSISIIFEDNSLNLELAEKIKSYFNQNKVSLNNQTSDTEVVIKIVDQSITRYSAALGSGARTREARLEYNLVFSLKNKDMVSEKFFEVNRNQNYSFGESRILALENEEEQIRDEFILFASERIRWFIANL